MAACASHKQREERVRELLDKQLLKADHDLDVSLKVKDEQLLRVAALKQEVCWPMLVNSVNKKYIRKFIVT